MRQDIPVIVIGGYLGAGKTTLLNHLLRHADGRKIAILVNEFGDLPIDADLIEAKDDEMIAISGGCICCSFGSDMTAALIKLAQLDPAPDYVVIEASGVAMPAAVAASISFLDGFNLGGVVVLADSERIRAQAADEYLGDTMLRQISDADLIVQTKIDLISSDVVQDVRDWLGSANPKAQVVATAQGRLPPAVILGVEMVAGQPQASAHADAGYESRVFSEIPPCDPIKLAKALATGAVGIIRAKGFVADQAGQNWLIQIVGERFDVTLAKAKEHIAVVCIGRKGALETGAIGVMFAGDTG
tara:strand:- start:311 stop:1213 length:903 start_codon:yes stop_codon:yes gene_type:complete